MVCAPTIDCGLIEENNMGLPIRTNVIVILLLYWRLLSYYWVSNWKIGATMYANNVSTKRKKAVFPSLNHASNFHNILFVNKKSHG